MAEQRQFVGDEVHMMASDIAILRNENELLKMTSERKAEENRILRADLTELRAKYEEKVTEASALYTILQNAAQGIHHGLERYLERRTLKKETVLASGGRHPPLSNDERVQPRTRPLADEVTRVTPATTRVPVARTPEPDTPPPAFLRPGQMRTDIVDHRLPSLEVVSDEDQLRALHQNLERKR